MLKLRTIAFGFLLATISALVAVPTAGCAAGAAAAVVSALPDIIAVIQEAGLILDSVQTFMSAYWVNHPNAAEQAKCDAAIAKARAALIVAQRGAAGAKDLSDANVVAAFTDFQAAYNELMVIVEPYGVKRDKVGGLKAGPVQPGTLTVPEPTMFKYTAKKEGK